MVLPKEAFALLEKTASKATGFKALNSKQLAVLKKLWDDWRNKPKWQKRGLAAWYAQPEVKVALGLTQNDRIPGFIKRLKHKELAKAIALGEADSTNLFGRKVNNLKVDKDSAWSGYKKVIDKDDDERQAPYHGVKPRFTPSRTSNEDRAMSLGKLVENIMGAAGFDGVVRHSDVKIRIDNRPKAKSVEETIDAKKFGKDLALKLLKNPKLKGRFKSDDVVWLSAVAAAFVKKNEKLLMKKARAGNMDGVMGKFWEYAKKAERKRGKAEGLGEDMGKNHYPAPKKSTKKLWELTSSGTKMKKWVNTFNNGQYIKRDRKGHHFYGTYAVAEGVARAGFDVKKVGVEKKMIRWFAKRNRDTMFEETDMSLENAAKNYEETYTFDEKLAKTSGASPFEVTGMAQSPDKSHNADLHGRKAGHHEIADGPYDDNAIVPAPFTAASAAYGKVLKTLD